MPKVGAAPPARQIEKVLATLAHEKEEELAERRAEAAGLPYVDLFDYPIAPPTLKLIPYEIASSLHLIPYLRVGGQLRVASTHPQDPAVREALEELGRRLGVAIVAVVCSKMSLLSALLQYQRLLGEEEKTQAGVRTARAAAPQPISSLAELASRLRTRSTSALLDTILAGAAGMRATDIHLEPGETVVRLRFRIDGVLREIAHLGREAYTPLLGRIKNLARLKLDITALPQDGRFAQTIGGRHFDFRVATLPQLWGEGVVIRVLESTRKPLTIAELGFSQAMSTALGEAIRKTSGLILASGPTGSGKTTTLYALLASLNSAERKIVTLENPIEYTLPGVSQSQVPEETYARALKAALRFDPDVIMVGEIRDTETAETALQAALTGHLVLSTFHATGVIEALIRLVEMGVRSYLLAGTVGLVTCQRLVRRLCENSCQAFEPDQRTRQWLAAHGFPKISRLWQAKPCTICQSTGYLGRTAIGEFIVPNEALERAIEVHTPIGEVERLLREQGFTPLLDDGLRLVTSGRTSLEEVLRVVGLS